MDSVQQVASVIKEGAGDLERILGKLEECYQVVSRDVEECRGVVVRQPKEVVRDITIRSGCPIGFFVAAGMASGDGDYLVKLRDALDAEKVPKGGGPPRRVEDVWALYHLKTGTPLSAEDAKIVLEHTFEGALVESGLYTSRWQEWDEIVRYLEKGKTAKRETQDWRDMEAHDLLERVSVVWDPQGKLKAKNYVICKEYDCEGWRAVRGMIWCMAQEGIEDKEAVLDTQYGKRKSPAREGYRRCERVVELVRSERVATLLRYVNVSQEYMENYIGRFQLYPEQVLMILREVEENYVHACSYMELPMQTWRLAKRRIAKLMREDEVPVKRARTRK